MKVSLEMTLLMAPVKATYSTMTSEAWYSQFFHIHVARNSHARHLFLYPFIFLQCYINNYLELSWYKIMSNNLIPWISCTSRRSTRSTSYGGGAMDDISYRRMQCGRRHGISWLAFYHPVINIRLVHGVGQGSLARNRLCGNSSVVGSNETQRHAWTWR
jgi:hypothetical protein